MPTDDCQYVPHLALDLWYVWSACVFYLIAALAVDIVDCGYGIALDLPAVMLV